MPAAVSTASVWIAQQIGNAVLSIVTAVTGSGYAATVAYNFAVTAAYHAAQIAIYAGIQLGIDALTRPRPPGPQGAELQLAIDSDFPRQMLIGRRPTAGSLVARYSRGASLYNAHFVFQLADHPCTALEKVNADGRLVQDSALTHGARTEITAYSYSGGARVWMTWHDGRPGQTADANLVTNAALDPDVVAGTIDGWTTDHKGAGCAYVHVEVQYDSDILTSIPQFLFLVKGAPLYDRRLDTTAGGSGSQRYDDPATWVWTENAMVALDHYLLGYAVENEPLAFGVGLRASELPYEQFAAAADLCDEDVETGTGDDIETIKRYCAHAIIGSDEFFEDVIGGLQLQMAARIVDLGGRIGILGAEARLSTVTLTDDDWVTDEAVQFSDKLAFSELIGSVAGTFVDPGNLYQPTPYDTALLTTENAALPDGGEASAVTLDFAYEIHPRRAVRLASAWLARESLQPRVIGTFGPAAWILEPGDWFVLQSGRLQLLAEVFEVIDIVKNQDFTVSLTARAMNEDFLAFDSGDDGELTFPSEVDPVDVLLDEPTGTVIAVSLSGGGATEPALRFTLATFDPLARELVIEVQLWTGSAFTGDPIIAVAHADELVTLIRAGILPDKQYKARIKSRAGFKESPWTAWSSAISTSATYLVPAASVGTSIVGQGALATLNGVYFGSTLITETSGGSNATLGNFKTVLGTAAAIIGQAAAATDATIEAGATKNTLTFSGSAPGSPTNGDIWVDTSASPYVVKSRVAGAWQGSASYGGIFGSTLYETGGGALASLSNFKTILGTAAAFTGQTAWATEPTPTASVLIPAPNVIPYPSGRGDGALATAVGWSASGGTTPTTVLTMFRYAPAGGDFYYEEWASGYNSAGHRYLIYEFAVNGPGPYTLSMRGSTDLTGVEYYIVSRNSGHTDTNNSALVPLSNTVRNPAPFTAPGGTIYLVVVVHIPPQNSSGAARSLIFRQIKVELGLVATTYQNDRIDVDADADVTIANTAAAITSQGALATLNDAAAVSYGTVTTGALTTSYVSKASKAVTSDGGPIEIEFSAFFELEEPGVDIGGISDVSAIITIKRSGTAILPDFKVCGFRYNFGDQIEFGTKRGGALVVDSPGAGTYTYTVEVKCSHSGADVGLDPMNIVSGANFIRIFNPIGAANAVSGP